MKRITAFFRANIILLAIVALGAALRFYGINFGLPYTYAPDEPALLTISLRMLKEPDLNPHWFGYPGLMFYLNLLLFLLYFVGGRLLGVWVSPAELPSIDVITVGVGKLVLADEFLLSRSLTALFGTACILLVYLLGKRLGVKPIVGLVAAFLFAVSPANVANSHLIRPDTFAVFFLLMATFWIDRALVKPDFRNYLVAGIGIGLATAAKYNAGLVASSLIVAHWCNFGARGFLRKEIYLAGVVSVLTFLIFNPYAILDVPGFFVGLGLASAAQTSHAGAEGDTVAWYINYLWGTEGWIALLALFQTVRIILTRDKRGIVFLSFPVLYYVFINFFAVRNDRTVMLVIPYLDVLAALFLIFAYEQIINARVSKRIAIVLSMLAVAAIAFVPFSQSFQNDLDLLKIDSRETARVWIENNLPPSSRIYVEPYGPYIDSTRFVVEGGGMAEHPLDWYVQNGFEYLVFSYGAYGRFVNNRAQYANIASVYDEFFARFPELKRFDDGGSSIRIHQTGVRNLPAHRVGARFGIFGDWLELVGFDSRPAQAGKTIGIDLTWRVIEPRRESFNLTVRLLDRNGDEIAQSTGALFDANPGTGIVRVTRNIPSPGEPGQYRLQIELDAQGQGRVPVLSRQREPIADKLFLAPFKIAPASEDLHAARAIDFRLGDAVGVVGYSLAGRTARPGESLNLSVYWKSVAKVNQDYIVFVHLLDAGGNVRAQIDAQPRGGNYPTSIWDVGEIVRDDYEFALPRDLTPGEYKIVLGMYEYPSLVRLNIRDAAGRNIGDHLTLDTLQVAR